MSATAIDLQPYGSVNDEDCDKRILRARQALGDRVVILGYLMSPMLCMCPTMFRIDPQHLAWVLENLVGGNVVNQIPVPEDVANNARIALQSMLDI